MRLLLCSSGNRTKKNKFSRETDKARDAHNFLAAHNLVGLEALLRVISEGNRNFRGRKVDTFEQMFSLIDVDGGGPSPCSCGLRLARRVTPVGLCVAHSSRDRL